MGELEAVVPVNAVLASIVVLSEPDDDSDGDHSGDYISFDDMNRKVDGKRQPNI